MDTASQISSPDDSPYINRRRRVDRLNPKPEPVKRNLVLAFGFAENLDLDSLQSKVELLVVQLNGKTRLSQEVLMLKMSKDRYAYLFDFGVAVFWGATHDFCNKVVQMLCTFTSKRLVQVEIESFTFKVVETFNIAHDLISMATNDNEEKLAVSYAVAQSLQLSCFEDTVSTFSDKSERIQIDLAEKGEFSIGHKESTQEIAKLLDFKIQVNLQSNLLDTPDLLWDDDRAQGIYSKVKNYLDVIKRVSILNQRLEVMSELLWFFNSAHRARRLYNLDLTIMLLVLAYVLCEVLWGIITRDILGTFRR
mmetsp:Transcript_18186/g.32596  ORF Transcript_18186/g.32596 Transcript_18186/m.32596 type:complete len:307 (+) Transcript_18186:84-1004(+)